MREGGSRPGCILRYVAISMAYEDDRLLSALDQRDMVGASDILGIGQPMELRSRITEAMKSAMKAREADRLSTLRLINAAIKDRDIALRGEGGDASVGDAEVLKILGKMVKQRHESARAYDEGGRLELAQKERAEIEVIEEFLPRQLDDEETEKAIASAISETGASSIRDMGKVMGHLKSKYTGQMDFGTVGPMIKDRLS